MTILDLNASAINTKVNNSFLNMALKKPITKSTINSKSTSLSHLNRQLIAASIDLVNVKQTTTKSTKIPIKSAYHKIDWQWQPSGVESTIFSNDRKSVCIHAECESCFETDAVRGNQPLKKNAFTYWEVTVLAHKLGGTSVQIGVGNNKARLNTLGYMHLLGRDSNSYGLSHTGQKWHQNESQKFCEVWNNSDDTEITIGCLFNGYNGQLSYFKNGVFLGIAFSDIDMKESLYPMVSSTVAQSVFRLNNVYETFPSLKDLCRKKILSEGIQLKGQLLPETILNFLRI